MATYKPEPKPEPVCASPHQTESKQQDQKIAEDVIENPVMVPIHKDLSSILTNVRVHEHRINDLVRNQDEIEMQLNGISDVLNNLNSNTNTLNDKIDVIAQSSAGELNRRAIIIDTSLSQPVDNENELIQLEKDARNEEFVQKVLTKFGGIFGKHVGKGGTVALQLIYRIFTKEFLVKCSWAGGARSTGSAKIPFKNHPHVIDLFFKIVQFCDPEYPYQSCIQFLQNRIKNAVQNQLSQNLRASTQRPNRKRKANAKKAIRNLNAAVCTIKEE